jgi:hypothetical protein
MGAAAVQKKIIQKWGAPEWKLLKTNVEKLSAFGSVWILLINKLLIGILCGY